MIINSTHRTNMRHPAPLPASPALVCYTRIRENQCCPQSLGHRGVTGPWPHPCDASCKKTPSDASQNLAPPPQPTEKEELKTR
jgi:hypothetical protein